MDPQGLHLAASSAWPLRRSEKSFFFGPSCEEPGGPQRSLCVRSLRESQSVDLQPRCNLPVRPLDRACVRSRHRRQGRHFWLPRPAASAYHHFPHEAKIFRVHFSDTPMFNYLGLL